MTLWHGNYVSSCVRDSEAFFGYCHSNAESFPKRKLKNAHSANFGRESPLC